MFKHILLTAMLSAVQTPAWADIDCESVVLDARSAVDFNDVNAAIMIMQDPSQKACLLPEHVSALNRVLASSRGNQQPQSIRNESNVQALKSLCSASALMFNNRQIDANNWRQLDPSTFIYDINTCVIVNDNDKTTAVVTP